jgi:hypothetical protein
MSNEKMSAEEFLNKIKELELEVPLQKFLQSNVDKKVEQILQKKMEDLKILSVREKLITDALEKAELSSGNFAKYVTGDSKEQIEESVAKLREDFLGIKQERIDRKIENATAPDVSNVASTDVDMEDYLEKRNKSADSKPNVGFPQESEK